MSGVLGKDINEQVNNLVQQVQALPDDQKQALLEGIGGSIGNILLKIVLDNAQKWLQDPAIQKMVFDKLVEIISNFFKK